jgi:hypothetical protein
MNTRKPSLMEVLQPHRFPSNPKRTEATRTILQPELDRYEMAEAAAAADDHGEESCLAARPRRAAAAGAA